MVFEAKSQDQIEISERGPGRRRRRGSHFRHRGRGGGPPMGPALIADLGTSQTMHSSETKDEQAEVFWQEVEKNWFGPIPEVLLNAIDRQLSVGEHFLQVYDVLHGESRTPPPSNKSIELPFVHKALLSDPSHSQDLVQQQFKRDVVVGTVGEQSDLSQKRFHGTTAACSVTLRPDDEGKGIPFIGPWQYLIAQSYLMDLFCTGENTKPELYHRLLSSSAMDLLNLDVFTCSLLGYPLMDQLESRTRDSIKEILKKRNIEAFPTKAAPSENFRQISTTNAEVQQDDPNLCSVEFLMQAFGVTCNTKRVPISRPFVALEQTFAELQVKSRQNIYGLPIIRPRGNPDAIRLLLLFPLSGYSIANYPKDLVQRLKQVRDWPEFLQAVLEAHLSHRQSRQLVGCPAITALEMLDDRKGCHDDKQRHNLHRVKVPFVFRLPRAIIGPQPLWDATALTGEEIQRPKRPCPKEFFAITNPPSKKFKRIEEAGDGIPQPPPLLSFNSPSLLASPRSSGKLTPAPLKEDGMVDGAIDVTGSLHIPPSTPLFQPKWSMVATPEARDLTTIDGIEVEDNPYLIFQSPRKYRRVLLKSGVFDDPFGLKSQEEPFPLVQKVQSPLSSNLPSVSPVDSHFPMIRSSNSSLNQSPQRLNSGSLAPVVQQQPTSQTLTTAASVVSPLSELDQEHLNLLGHLKSIVQTKCALLDRFKARIATRHSCNDALWRDTEQKMVELYRQEFFNQTLSGRHSYTLARQYRDLDFIRMLALNGNVLPSWWTEQALCCVCGNGMAFDDDPIIFCDACFLPAHHACVGYQAGRPFPPNLDVPEIGSLGSASGASRISSALVKKESSITLTSNGARKSNQIAERSTKREMPSSESRTSVQSVMSEQSDDEDSSTPEDANARQPKRKASSPKDSARAPPTPRTKKDKGTKENATENSIIHTSQEIGTEILDEPTENRSTEVVGTVEEEWFCNCCQMIIHQIGDLPTAMVVVRHLAGPRTPKEFEEALCHEKAALLPSDMRWYLPTLINEENEPVMMREFFEFRESHGRVTETAGANGCVKAELLQKKRGPSPPVSATIETQGETSTVKTERLTRSGRGGRGKRGRPRVRGSCSVSERKSSLDFRYSLKEDAESVDTTMGDMTSEAPNIEPPASTSNEPIACRLHSRRQYFSRLHTKNVTHFYLWKITIEEQEVSKCQITLKNTGSGRRRRRNQQTEGPMSTISTSTREQTEARPLKCSNERKRSRAPSKPSSTEQPAQESSSSINTRREWRISGLAGFSPLRNEQECKSNDRDESTLEFIVRVPCCSLCGYDAYFKGGGVIKKGVSGKKRREYAHIRCALGIDGTVAPDALRYTVEPERSRLRCNFCHQTGPAPVQCGHAQCPKPYHVSCGTQALECVSEFHEVRPIIYCNTHSKEKPPTQSLRSYQLSVERTKRIKKRIEEERAPFMSSSASLSSWFLRQLITVTNISGTSLDVLFPKTMTSLFCAIPVKDEYCDSSSKTTASPAVPTPVQSSQNVAEDAGDVGVGPTGFVKSRYRGTKATTTGLSTSILSPSVLLRCPNGVADVLGRGRTGTDSPPLASSSGASNGATVDGHENTNQASSIDLLSAVRVPGASHGFLDSILWEATGLNCGVLIELREQRRGYNTYSSAFSKSHDGHIPEGHEFEKAKHLTVEEAEVTGSYQIYQGKSGSLGVQNLTDMALRLFLYLKGSPPNCYDLNELTDVVLSTAKSWDLCGLQWVTYSSIKPDHDSPLRWKSSAKSLLKAIVVSAEIEEVFDQWVCSGCGKEVQLWAAHGSNSQDFLDRILVTPDALSSFAFRCSCCGCCICTSCCSSNCSLELLSELAVALESATEQHVTHNTSDENIAEPPSQADSQLKIQPAPTGKRTRSEGAISIGYEQDQADVIEGLQTQRLLQTVTAIVKYDRLLCPRCEHFFWKPFLADKKGASPQSGTPSHPSLLGACVLCNRCDGFLVKRQGQSIVDSSSGSNWSVMGLNSSLTPLERYDQSAGVHWVHPYCAEWFVPPKLKGTGIRHVGRILKKYGSRPGGLQDSSIVTTTVAVSRPEPSLSCYICGFVTGALWTCSHPKCTQAFHVSCARLWGCKFDIQGRKLTTSGILTNSNPSAMARRAYCSEHSFSITQQSQMWLKDNDLVNWLTSLAMNVSCWSSSFSQKMWKQLNSGEPVDLSLQLIQSFIVGVGGLPLVFPSGLPTHVNVNWEPGRGALGDLSILRRKSKIVHTRPEKKVKKMEHLSEGDSSSSEDERKSSEEIRCLQAKNLVFVRTQAALLEEMAEVGDLKHENLLTKISRNHILQEVTSTDRQKRRCFSDATTISQEEDDIDLQSCDAQLKENSVSPVTTQRDFWGRENKRRVLGRPPDSMSPRLDVSPTRMVGLSSDVGPYKSRMLTKDLEEFGLPREGVEISSKIGRKRRPVMALRYGPDGQPVRRPRGRPRKYPITETGSRRKAEPVSVREEQRLLKQNHHQQQAQQRVLGEIATSPSLPVAPRQPLTSPIHGFQLPFTMSTQVASTTSMFGGLMGRPGMRMSSPLLPLGSPAQGPGSPSLFWLPGPDTTMTPFMMPAGAMGFAPEGQFRGSTIPPMMRPPYWPPQVIGTSTTPTQGIIHQIPMRPSYSPPQTTPVGSHRSLTGSLASTSSSSASVFLAVPSSPNLDVPPASSVSTISWTKPEADRATSQRWNSLEIEKECRCGMCAVLYHWNDGSSWIACDNCDEWFHWYCVGITSQSKALEAAEWNCPKCRPFVFCPSR